VTHRLPRGHSNVYADEARPWPGDEGKALVPLVGGAALDTCRPLPPLALTMAQWQTIGLLMGWITARPRRKGVRRG
jgi:hypothetical protein